MEAILSIIGIFVFFAVLNIVLSAGGRAVSAVTRAATGKGSLSENLEVAFKGIGPFEIKLHDTQLSSDSGAIVKEIQGKGLFPVQKAMNIGFITSVFDKTSGELEPVLSFIEDFQEPESIIYQHRIQIGKVTPDQGFIKWVRLGVVIPDIIQPPYRGTRKLIAYIRMVDMDNLPAITHGFHAPDQPGLLWMTGLEFEWTFSEKGYNEEAADRDEARAISLKIGMAVAMADGSLAEEEGTVLKHWILRAIDPFTDEKQIELKEIYNTAMKEAHKEAKNGDLSLSSLTGRLNEIGERAIKYEAIELCFDVMAADGVADANEMKLIHKVADALELDLDQISKMRDQKIINLKDSASGQATIEDLLGIDPEWDKDAIKKHLRLEFQKWNNRLNTLPEGEERDNAQRMLELISETRKKYV